MMLDSKKKGLRYLLKAKGSAPKDASGSQPLLTLLPPPPLVNIFALANLKKRKKENEGIKEGELVPQKDGVPPPPQATKDD